MEADAEFILRQKINFINRKYIPKCGQQYYWQHVGSYFLPIVCTQKKVIFLLFKSNLLLFWFMYISKFPAILFYIRLERNRLKGT